MRGGCCSRRASRRERDARGDIAVLDVTRHVVDLLRLMVVATGPVPFGLVIARAPGPAAIAWARVALAVLTVWCVPQVSVALGLGVLGHYALTPVLVAESVLFLAGLAVAVRPAGAARLRLKTTPRPHHHQTRLQCVRPARPARGPIRWSAHCWSSPRSWR